MPLRSLIVTLSLFAFCIQFAASSKKAIGQIASVQESRWVFDSTSATPHIKRVVEKAIDAKKFPGAVVCIGQRDGIKFLKAFGHRQLKPKTEPMTTTTVFDLASLTKPIAAATSIMLLVERGQVRLRDRVSVYLPEFANNGKEKITITDLLTHMSGLIPDNSIRDYDDGPGTAMRKIMQLRPIHDVGSKFAYSDVGFIVLAEIVKRVSGKSIAEFSRQNLFAPLHMKDTMYNPTKELSLLAAPTQQREGRWMRGEVHDPRAYKLNGIAGHAGLFSTAKDLAIFAQMMLNNGKYQTKKDNHKVEWRQLLGERTIDVMTSRRSTPSTGYRTLGWDALSGYSSNRGELMSERAFGHGGFTGTSIWIDPELDLFVVFLSNRVHPDGDGSSNRTAGQVGTIAAGAMRKSPLKTK